MPLASYVPTYLPRYLERYSNIDRHGTGPRLISPASLAEALLVLVSISKCCYGMTLRLMVAQTLSNMGCKAKMMVITVTALWFLKLPFSGMLVFQYKDELPNDFNVSRSKPCTGRHSRRHPPHPPQPPKGKPPSHDAGDAGMTL